VIARRGGGRPPAYKTKDGKRVPGVTTITGRFKDSGGLVRWAFNCGRDGIDMDKARDSAASAGSYAHAWIEDEIHGELMTPFPDADQELLKMAGVGLAAFREYREQTRIEVLSTEEALISEVHRYGGTYDALVKINGKLMIWDLKSSNRVYPEYLSQLAAYQILLEEHGHTDFQGGQILRVGKDYGDFHVHNYPAHVMSRAKETFLLMRRLYDLDAELKKVAA
jgi:hypothetical protein